MPPKKKFTAEQIVETAFHIAKTEGMDSITIRKVAEQMGSSIAPIYVNFEDVEELKRAVVQRVHELGKQMVLEQDTGSPFGDIGAASLQFAKEYPILFRDLAMKPNDYMQNYDQDMGDALVSHMEQDPDLAEFDEEELRLILFKMRVFQAGLSIMAVNGQLPAEMDLDHLKALLDDAAEDVVLAARWRKSKGSN